LLVTIAAIYSAREKEKPIELKTDSSRHFLKRIPLSSFGLGNVEDECPGAFLYKAFGVLSFTIVRELCVESIFVINIR